MSAVQELGNSETSVMSQKAVTETVSKINSKILLEIRDAKLGDNSSSIYSNRENIYSDYFKLNITECTLQTNSKNLSIAVTTSKDVYYEALRNIESGKEYEFSVEGAISCIIYVEKEDLTVEGNVIAELVSGELQVFNKKFNDDISSLNEEIEDIQKGTLTEENVREIVSNEIQEKLSIENNVFGLYDTQYFKPTYNVNSGELSFDSPKNQATLYVTYNSEEEKDIIFVGNDKATLGNVIVYHGEGNETQQLFKPYKINPSDFSDGINYIALVFNSVDGNNFNTLGGIGYVYADKPNTFILDKVENIESEIEQIQLDIDEIKGNNNSSNPIIISKGRFYDPIVTANQTALEVGNSFNTIFGRKSMYLKGSGWHSSTITGFEHNVGEKINIFFYVDSKLLNITNETQSDYLSTILVRFKNVDNADIYYEQFSATYQLVNGWNCIESPILNEDCKNIVFENYNQKENEYCLIIGAINVGRKTKAVMTISHDGIYADSYNSGIYQLHKTLNIPITIIAASVYETDSDEVNYCKELEKIGLAEFGIYTGETRTQTDFKTADEYFYNLLLPYKDNTSKDLIVAGCQHNRLSKYVEEAGISNGIKVFRCSCNKRNILLDCEGLRAIHTQSNIITEGWNEDKNSDAITSAKSYIDDLINNGSWGDLMTHQVVKLADIQSDDYNLATTYEYWQEVLNYLKQKIDSGGIIVTTIGSLYKIVN